MSYRNHESTPPELWHACAYLVHIQLLVSVLCQGLIGWQNRGGQRAHVDFDDDSSENLFCQLPKPWQQTYIYNSIDTWLDCNFWTGCMHEMTCCAVTSFILYSSTWSLSTYIWWAAKAYKAWELLRQSVSAQQLQRACVYRPGHMKEERPQRRARVWANNTLKSNMPNTQAGWDYAINNVLSRIPIFLSTVCQESINTQNEIWFHTLLTGGLTCW